MKQSTIVPPPPTNNLVTPLLTDLYQITMAYGYWKSNKQNDQAVFELFFRKNPFKGAFTIFCGIDEVLSFIHHFKFSREDIAYLKSTPALCNCEEEFFTYLSNLDCSEIKMQSLQQGSIAFPRVPLITLSGPLGICQLVETTLLNLVNFPSLIATNAARMVIEAKGQHETNKIFGKIPLCVEYGLRRAQSPDGGYSASKYCIVGGFDGTANVQAGKMLGIPIFGTHAHAFVQSFSSLDEVRDHTVKTTKGEVLLLPLVLSYRKKFGGEWLDTNDGELAAFIAYAAAFPSGTISLIDTYDTLSSGVKNFILVAMALHECGYTAKGVRLDSGDLAALSMACRKIFADMADEHNLPFFEDLTILASNDINEKTLRELNAVGHGISGFGIGTNLVTCQAQPALGCVFKLVSLNGKPRIKLSNDAEKVLIPGEKRAFRLFDENGVTLMDVLIDIDEDIIPLASREFTVHEVSGGEPVKITPSVVQELLNTVWDKENGVVFKIHNIMEAKGFAKKQIQALHPDMVRAKNPMKCKVFLSKKLQNKLHKLLKSMTSAHPVEDEARREIL